MITATYNNINMQLLLSIMGWYNNFEKIEKFIYLSVQLEGRGQRENHICNQE